jgi:hypothetical protein
MSSKQGADLFDAMQKRFGKVATLETGLHPLDDFTPEIVSAFGVNRRVTNHRKSMRDRSDKEQYGVPQRCLVHLQLLEALASRVEWVIRFFATDKDAYFTAGPFFSAGDRRHNSVVIDSLEEMIGFHARSLFESPTTARAATAAVTAAARKASSTTAPRVPSAASSASAPAAATDPPYAPGTA